MQSRRRLRFTTILFVGFLTNAPWVLAGEKKVDLCLKPAAQVLSQGEPVFVSLEIKNRTSKKLGLDLGKNYRGNLAVTVHEPDGSVRKPATYSEGIYVPGLFDLGPGQEYSDRLLMDEYEPFDKLGTYKIVVSFKNVVTNPLNVLLRNIEAEVKIVPHDPERLAKRCDELLQAILHNGPEATAAASALGHVHESTCFQQLSQVLNKAVGYRRAAIVGLAYMNDPRALNEIMKAWGSLGWDEQALALSEFEKQGKKGEVERLLAAEGKKLKPVFSDH